MSYVVHDGKVFAIALRYSGAFDIYVNMMFKTEVHTCKLNLNLTLYR
jgi:hypothetical protein